MKNMALFFFRVKNLGYNEAVNRFERRIIIMKKNYLGNVRNMSDTKVLEQAKAAGYKPVLVPSIGNAMTFKKGNRRVKILINGEVYGYLGRA